ncbi:SEED MATURATION PROTEIN 1 [Phragmites australis]|uniref:SEED MATURATION PROTEIN 1 n=1 Tax=Phragmites australis TaxID=29695 RepID=UPI002D766ECE|nr:SEED MATURATION PROTEIN 1 [Phragmites australis]
MAQSKEDIKHGTARTKVAGDDEMLRTGFHNGTPLEAGKIADSQPVDLFAPAHRVADAPSQQQQQQMRPQEDELAEANDDDSAPAQGRGMAEPTAGGRRLGRQA